MKKFLSIAFALAILGLFVGQADAARQVVKAKTVVKQRGNKTVTKTKTVVKGKGNANAATATANVNVNVNAGHGVNAVAKVNHVNTVAVVNHNHFNSFAAVSHAGFAVAHNHYHNTAFVHNHGYGYNYNQFAIVQPVQFAVAYTQPVVNVPVDIVNAPPVVTQTTTTTAAPVTTCQTTAAVANYGYTGTQQIVQTQVIKRVNIPVGVVGVHAGY